MGALYAGDTRNIATFDFRLDVFSFFTDHTRDPPHIPYMLNSAGVRILIKPGTTDFCLARFKGCLKTKDRNDHGHPDTSVAFIVRTVHFFGSPFTILRIY